MQYAGYKLNCTIRIMNTYSDIAVESFLINADIPVDTSIYFY